MGWKNQTSGTTTTGGGTDEANWQSLREIALEHELHGLTQQLQVAGLTDARYEKELRFIHERAGFTSDGIPLSAGRMAQLAAEDKGWGSYGTALEWEPYQNREHVARYLVEKYYQGGVCRNIINNYVHFTVGSGFSVSFETDARQAEFDAWAEAKSLWQLQKKWVLEKALFGSAPMVLYPLTWGDTARKITPTRTAMPGRRAPADAFRVLPDAKLTAIHTREGDYMDVTAYQFGSLMVAPQDVILSAESALGLGLRGSSVLTPALEDILKLDKIADSRFYLNLVRSRMPAVRRVPKGAAKDSVNSNLKKLPPAGSVVTEYGGVEWDFPSHNVDASGAKDDWRLLVLRIAAAVSLPEWLVLQDASNSNYSSTLVAESPAHVMFTQRQIEAKRELATLLTACGWTDFTVQEPNILPRDMRAEAQAVQIATAAGVMSKRSGAKRLSLNYDEEVQNMLVDEDSPMEGEPLFPPAQPDDDDQGGDEDGDEDEA